MQIQYLKKVPNITKNIEITYQQIKLLKRVQTCKRKGFLEKKKAELGMLKKGWKRFAGMAFNAVHFYVPNSV